MYLLYADISAIPPERCSNSLKICHQKFSQMVFLGEKIYVVCTQGANIYPVIYDMDASTIYIHGIMYQI